MSLHNWKQLLQKFGRTTHMYATSNRHLLNTTEIFKKNLAFIVVIFNAIAGVQHLFNTSSESIHRDRICLKTSLFLVQQNTFSITDNPWTWIPMLGSTSMVNMQMFFYVVKCGGNLYRALSLSFSGIPPTLVKLIAEIIWLSQAENYFHLYVTAFSSITNKMWALPIEMYLMQCIELMEYF